MNLLLLREIANIDPRPCVYNTECPRHTYKTQQQYWLCPEHDHMTVLQDMLKKHTCNDITGLIMDYYCGVDDNKQSNLKQYISVSYCDTCDEILNPNDIDDAIVYGCGGHYDAFIADVTVSFVYHMQHGNLLMAEQLLKTNHIDDQYKISAVVLCIENNYINMTKYILNLHEIKDYITVGGRIIHSAKTTGNKDFFQYILERHMIEEFPEYTINTNVENRLTEI